MTRNNDASMSDVSNFDPSVIVPQDGKIINQASLKGMLQPLANRTRYLLNQQTGIPYLVYRNGGFSAIYAVTPYSTALYESLQPTITSPQILAGDWVEISGYWILGITATSANGTFAQVNQCVSTIQNAMYLTTGPGSLTAGTGFTPCPDVTIPLQNNGYVQFIRTFVVQNVQVTTPGSFTQYINRFTQLISSLGVAVTGTFVSPNINIAGQAQFSIKFYHS